MKIFSKVTSKVKSVRYYSEDFPGFCIALTDAPVLLLLINTLISVCSQLFAVF